MNRTVLTSPVHFLAFGFGSGLSPKAPGTMGTLAAIPLYLLLMNLPLTSYLLAVLLISVAGIWICGESSRRLGVHDHGGIVWDEFAGFLLTMTAAPQGWAWIVLGFALFRLFDIWKPWPVRVADRQLHGGLGIMLDDILAGIYAWLVLQAVAYVV
ncbi:phosphatidylglycerophosphatase A family protein [Thiothrix unzii]|uniref:phosphatidylglycerophosphatase A family protein n=1 Tax=Thiothrix unzii TaxID=111769 RepID=UPI001FE50D22|nr:phosphatidylglycerophosphatase A [Thiothrix unzii]